MHSKCKYCPTTLNIIHHKEMIFKCIYKRLNITGIASSSQIYV